MLKAYNQQYLDDAMTSMGEMMDYVHSDCKMDMDEFFSLFISTGYAERFGKGTPDIVAGKSGIELTWEVFEASGYRKGFAEPGERFYRTAAYWCGWILAYYQWSSGRSFREIMHYLSFKKLEGMYPTFHETAEERFTDAIEDLIHSANTPVKLQTLRKREGLSQRQLAEKSGVSLRAVQQYEQRQKDINKAQASSLAAMARILGCRIEDLLEYGSTQ